MLLFYIHLPPNLTNKKTKQFNIQNVMIKKLSFLLILSVSLFSCESESFEEQVSALENTENDSEPAVDQDKIIDEYRDINRGL